MSPVLLDTPTTLHTRQSVRDLIQARWESEMPDQVLAALARWNGKTVTTRILNDLPGGKETWRLQRQYGMTHLANWAYIRSQGSAKDGISLLMAHTEASFTLDLADLEARNAGYFSARRERNHARMETVNDAAKLDAIAARMNDVERHMLALKTAEADLANLAGPDHYAIEAACALRDKNGRRIDR
jgi:hypothetical protein